jgi:hypothetical protein
VGAVPRRKAEREKGKHFFFEKKKQKTFDYSASVLQERPKPNSQSFLVLFFKKEPLSAACQARSRTPIGKSFWSASLLAASDVSVSKLD